MQWSADVNAGFSRAEPAQLYSPVSTDALYNYQAVNVVVSEHVESSLLRWVRRMIRARKTTRAFGRGDLTFIETENAAVLAFVRAYEGEVVLVVANLSRFVQPATLALAAHRGKRPRELIGDAVFPEITDRYFLSLGPHAFYWFRLTTP
jgi:maltose alpha-D-glucosyltransferase/alpha-amylase